MKQAYDCMQRNYYQRYNECIRRSFSRKERPCLLSKQVQFWLYSQNSLTRMLESCYQQLEFCLLFEVMINTQYLTKFEQGLLNQYPPFMGMRAIQFKYAGKPILYALSLIPESIQKDFQMHNNPIGSIIFNQTDTCIKKVRESLHLRQIHFEKSLLNARCSTLWYQNEQIILYELFLSDFQFDLQPK